MTEKLTILQNTLYSQPRTKSILRCRFWMTYRIVHSHFNIIAYILSPRRYSKRTSQIFKARFVLLNKNDFLRTGNLLSFPVPQALREFNACSSQSLKSTTIKEVCINAKEKKLCHCSINRVYIRIKRGRCKIDE